MHPFARALSGVSSLSQVDRLSLVSGLSLAVCHNARCPCALQVSARAVGLARLPQQSRLIVDHSVLLPVLQPYPLAMNFVHGIDPDSHLLGGWQLDPSKLNTNTGQSMALTPFAARMAVFMIWALADTPRRRAPRAVLPQAVHPAV